MRRTFIKKSLYFIEVPLLLVQDGCNSVRPLHVHHEIFNLILQSVFGLLQGGTFSINGLNGLLSILETLSQLLPAGLPWVYKKLKEVKRRSTRCANIQNNLRSCAHLASSSSSVLWMASVSYLVLHWDTSELALDIPRDRTIWKEHVNIIVAKIIAY